MDISSINQYLVDRFWRTFDGAGVVDVAAYSEEFCACVAFTAETGEPFGSTTDNCWDDSDGLDVGDGCGTSE
jgi:hypothetical protein